MQLLINVVIDFHYDDHQVPSEPVTHVNTTLALIHVNCKDHPGTNTCTDHP